MAWNRSTPNIENERKPAKKYGLEDLLVGKDETIDRAMTEREDELIALLSVEGSDAEVDALYDHIQSCRLELGDGKTLRVYKALPKAVWCEWLRSLRPFIRNPERVKKRIPKDVFELLLTRVNGFRDFVDEHGGIVIVTAWSSRHVQELKRIDWVPR